MRPGSGLPFEIEQRARRKDGQYRWFLIRYNPFRDERDNWCAGMRREPTSISEARRDRTVNENVALREISYAHPCSRNRRFLRAIAKK